MSENPDPIARVNISIPESLRVKVQDLARVNDRAFSREVRRALEAHLNKESK